MKITIENHNILLIKLLNYFTDFASCGQSRSNNAQLQYSSNCWSVSGL